MQFLLLKIKDALEINTRGQVRADRYWKNIASGKTEKRST